MSIIIDLNSEILVDRSRLRDPYLRLLLAALGRQLAKGSAWVIIDKRLAAEYGFLPVVGAERHRAVA